MLAKAGGNNDLWVKIYAVGFVFTLGILAGYREEWAGANLWDMVVLLVIGCVWPFYLGLMLGMVARRVGSCACT